MEYKKANKTARNIMLSLSQKFTYPVNRLPWSTFAFWTLRIQAGCCQ